MGPLVALLALGGLALWVCGWIYLLMTVSRLAERAEKMLQWMRMHGERTQDQVRELQTTVRDLANIVKARTEQGPTSAPPPCPEIKAPVVAVAPPAPPAITPEPAAPTSEAVAAPPPEREKPAAPPPNPIPVPVPVEAEPEAPPAAPPPVRIEREPDRPKPTVAPLVKPVAAEPEKVDETALRRLTDAAPPKTPDALTIGDSARAGQSALVTLSPWEMKTQAAMQALTDWFVVGEGYRPRHVPMEYAVAVVWLMRGAALMLLGGFAYFLKYAHEHAILPPAARIGAVAAVGLAAVVGGVLMSGRKYRVPGVGLAGIGIGILIGAVFAGFQLYGLFGQTNAFMLVLAVVVLSGALSMRLNAQAVVLVGLVGAYLAPIVLNTGSKNLPGLFGYLGLLLVGLLGVSPFRQWRPAQWMALFGTAALYFGALHQHYRPADDFGVALAAACGFYVLFTGILFAPTWRSAFPFTMPDVILQNVTTILWIATATALTGDHCGRTWAAAVPAGAAVFLFLLHAFALLRVTGATRPLLWAMQAQIAILVTLAGGLFFTRGMNLYWFAQAAAMLWLSRRLVSRPLWVCGVLLGCLAGGRVLFVDAARWVHAAGPWSAGAADRFMTLGALTLGLLAGWAVSRRDARPEEAPIAAWIGAMRGIALVGALWSAFVYSTVEIYHTAGAFAPAFRGGGISLGWSVWAFALVLFGLARRVTTARRVGLTLFVIAAAKVLVLDMAGLETVYRVAALVGMGLAMLGGAFVYTRFTPDAPPPSA